MFFHPEFRGSSLSGTVTVVGTEVLAPNLESPGGKGLPNAGWPTRGTILVPSVLACTEESKEAKVGPWKGEPGRVSRKA